MDALTAARQVLRARLGDQRVRLIPGLADDLRAILGAFDDIERRTSLLAAVVLKKHYWPESALSPEQFAGLAEMCGEGIEHGAEHRARNV